MYLKNPVLAYELHTKKSYISLIVYYILLFIIKIKIFILLIIMYIFSFYYDNVDAKIKYNKYNVIHIVNNENNIPPAIKQYTA